MSFPLPIRAALSFLRQPEVRETRRRPSCRLGDAERLEPRRQLSVSVGMPVLDAKSDSGARDGVTAIVTPAFSGRVAKGTSAMLEITSIETGVVSTVKATTSKAGTWKAAVPRTTPLANGAYLVKAIQTATGVDPVASNALQIRIENRAPSVQSFAFDPATFTATLKFDMPVKGVSLKNFAISADWFPGWIRLSDRRAKPLGVQLSPGSGAGSDTYTIRLGRADLVEPGQYTLRFDPMQGAVVSTQTNVRVGSAGIRDVSAEL